MDMHQSKDFAFSVIGLEHLISHDIFKRWESIKATRKHHVKIVLQAQERLRRCHKFTCPEKLACAAENNSAKNRMKATTRAQLQHPLCMKFLDLEIAGTKLEIKMITVSEHSQSLQSSFRTVD